LKRTVLGSHEVQILTHQPTIDLTHVYAPHSYSIPRGVPDAKGQKGSNPSAEVFLPRRVRYAAC